jgi:hypothetical protein
MKLYETDQPDTYSVTEEALRNRAIKTFINAAQGQLIPNHSDFCYESF